MLSPDRPSILFTVDARDAVMAVNDRLIRDVWRTHEPVWFLAEQLVETPLVHT